MANMCSCITKTPFLTNFFLDPRMQRVRIVELAAWLQRTATAAMPPAIFPKPVAASLSHPCPTSQIENYAPRRCIATNLLASSPRKIHWYSKQQTKEGGQVGTILTLSFVCGNGLHNSGVKEKQGTQGVKSHSTNSKKKTEHKKGTMMVEDGRLCRHKMKTLYALMPCENVLNDTQHANRYTH